MFTYLKFSFITATVTQVHGAYVQGRTTHQLLFLLFTASELLFLF